MLVYTYCNSSYSKGRIKRMEVLGQPEQDSISTNKLDIFQENYANL
jgi:hypothetical protein